MRKPASGLESTLWAVGAVAGIYIVGAILLMVNLWTLAFPLENMLPRWMVAFFGTDLQSLGDLLASLKLLP